MYNCRFSTIENRAPHIVFRELHLKKFPVNKELSKKINNNNNNNNK